MKANKPWDMNLIKDFNNSLLKLLGNLRRYIDTREYHFILFLIVLHRDHVLENLRKAGYSDVKFELKNSIQNYEGRNSNTFKEFYYLFEQVINRLNDSVIYDILYLFNSIDHSLLKANFPEIFDSLVFGIAKLEGKFGAEYIQPKELSRLLIGIADLKENAWVYNPFAGIGSFAIALNNNSNYRGQEINKTTWAIGNLRLIAYNLESNSIIDCCDSIQSWLHYDKKFDLVIGNPPFNTRIAQDLRGWRDSYRTYDSFLISQGIENINQKGKLIAVVPLSFLSRTGADQSLRKSLLESDKIEMIINFPGGLLMNTSIPFGVIVISNSKRNMGYVQFVDATKFVESISQKEKCLLDSELLSVILSDKESESIRKVSNHEIIENDCNLMVNRYLIETPLQNEDQLNGEIIKLGEIASIQTREFAVEAGAKGRYIRIRDLKSDLLSGELNPHDVEITDIPKFSYPVQFGSLLISLRFKNLKPTLLSFRDSKEIAFISNDILALKIDTSLIDIHYLISELNSSFVQAQVNRFSSGATIPSISKKDIMNIKIRLLSKEEQQKKNHIYFESLYKIKDKELSDFQNQFNIIKYKDLASLKHSLGRPLLNIGSGIRIIESYILKTEDSELIKSLKNTFASLNSNLLLIDNLLDRNENELNLSDYKSDEIDLLSMLNDYLQDCNYVSFLPKLVIAKEISSEFSDKLFINGNKDLLVLLFNNILDNSERHGFKGGKNDSNTLIIELQIGEELSYPSLLITIKNNGLPFPENFDRGKFIQKNLKAGETGNTGIGGYDIDRIVKFMKGTFDLLINEDPNFPSIYKIELPLQNIKDNMDEEV